MKKVIIEFYYEDDEWLDEFYHNLSSNQNVDNLDIKKSEHKTMHKKIGTIEMNAKGLRQLADSFDNVYSEGITINLPVWKDKHGLFFQMVEDSGQIDFTKEK